MGDGGSGWAEPGSDPSSGDPAAGGSSTPAPEGYPAAPPYGTPPYQYPVWPPAPSAHGIPLPDRPPSKMNPGAWWAIGLGGAVLVVTMTMGVFMAAAANNDDDPVAQIPLPSPTTDASPPETEEEAPTSTVSEPELPPPTIPTTTVPAFDLTERTLVVGRDIEPGLYTANGQLCYWERVSGLAGTFDEVITNGNAGEHAVVEVLGGDAGLRSRGCSPWTPYAPPPGGPVTSFGDGDWVVGEQVPPGRYQSAGGALCSWERGSGFTHDFIDEVIDFDFGAAPAAVTLDEGERFTSWSCGTWTPG